MSLSIQRHTLACGMTMLIAENHESPVATADIWARTGAADEPPELSGVSHFLEHMLFKGTERYGLGEIERAIENVGGVCNAGTSYDFTHYYVTMPAPVIATGIAMLADMVRASTLDPRELEKERLVILEEYRRKQDHPAGVLYERLYEEVFEAGRYHRPVIGTEETIRAIDRERMLDYYHRRYGPENLTLIVTGDIEPAAAIDAAERATEGFARPVRSAWDGEAPAYGAGKRVRVTRHTGGELYVAFAFPAAGWDAPERVMPLDLAQCLLGQGRGARLFQELKERRGLCSSIGVSYPTHVADSLFVVTATCRPEQLDALREGVLAELEAFVAAPASDEDDRRARRLMGSAHRFSLETSGGLASQIGYTWTASGDLSHLERYLEILDATPRERVREAAVDCFRPGAMAERMIEVAVGPDGAGKDGANGREVAA